MNHHRGTERQKITYTLDGTLLCRMHGLDLFAYLAEVCTASMADLAVPQLLPASA